MRVLYKELLLRVLEKELRTPILNVFKILEVVLVVLEVVLVVLEVVLVVLVG